MGGSKSLPPEMSEHLTKELHALIKEKFTDERGTRWSQERLAEVLDCSQSQVSDLLRGDKFGIHTVVAMSRQSGKSIDELLGPTAPCYRRASRDGVITGKVVELLDRIDAAQFGFAGKNLRIPILMKEIRLLLNAPDEETFQKTLQDMAETLKMAVPPQKKRKAV